MPYEKALRPPPLGRGMGDVKPTPALPKGGGIMFFCPSVRVGVGFYLRVCQNRHILFFLFIYDNFLVSAVLCCNFHKFWLICAL